MRRQSAVWLAFVLALALLAPATVYAAEPPPNDWFANATRIDAFPYPSDVTTPETVDLASATVETGEPDTATQGCNRYRTKTVWYTYTAPATGAVVVGASDYAFTDLRLVTYSSAGGGFADLTRVGCRSGPTENPYPITSTVYVTAGATYYTQVSDNGSGGGAVSLTVRFYPTPDNDMFGSAASVTELPSSRPVDLWAATLETGEPNPCGLEGVAARRTVWYKLVPPGDGDVTVTVTGAGWDAPPPTVYLQSGPSLTLLGSPTCGAASTTTATVRAGEAYYVQVSNGPGGWGMAEIDFAFGAVVRPSNDDFESATVVPSLPWSDSTDIRRATMQTNFGEPNPCGGGSHTIWYAFTPDTPGFVTVDPAGSSFSDPTLTAYYAWGAGILRTHPHRLLTLQRATAVHGVPGDDVLRPGSGPVFRWRKAEAQLHIRPAAAAERRPDLRHGRVVAPLHRFGRHHERDGTVAGVQLVRRIHPDGLVSVHADRHGSRDGRQHRLCVRRRCPQRVHGRARQPLVRRMRLVRRLVHVRRSGRLDLLRSGGRRWLRRRHASRQPLGRCDRAERRVRGSEVDLRVPIDDRPDVAIATNEGGEPVAPCGQYAPLRTVWYRLTAPAKGTVSVGISDTIWSMSTLAAYRSDGAGLAGLTYLGCVDYPGPLTFDVRSGATYYVQAADWLAFGWVRNVDFSFTPAPDTTPPAITFAGTRRHTGWTPGSPSPPRPSMTWTAR